MNSGLPEDLQPWTRITVEKGKPGATWAVGVLQPCRCVLASNWASSAAEAREALQRACNRAKPVCEQLLEELAGKVAA